MLRSHSTLRTIRSRYRATARWVRRVARQAVVAITIAAIILSTTGWPVPQARADEPSQTTTAPSTAGEKSSSEAPRFVPAEDPAPPKAGCCCCKGGKKVAACCCTGKLKPAAGACCGKPSPPAASRSALPAPSSELPAFSPCPCGDGSDSDYLLSAQPRLGGNFAPALTLLPSGDSQPAATIGVPSRSIRPETPPPRLAA